MENAVDALKIAFAVFIFAIAVALTFSVVGQVRATSDVILALEDKTNAYDYVEESDTNAREKDRIVGFETILPAIYRYVEEQYAVTITDTNGKAIARYDLWTEGFMNEWDEILRLSGSSTNSQLKQDAETKKKQVKDRLELVENELNKTESDVKISIYEQLNEVYKVKNNNKFMCGAPWIGSTDEIIKRINCDLIGLDYSRNNITYNIKNHIQGNKKGLTEYKDKKFKEKFIEIQTSGTTITEEDGSSLETIKGNKKLEIVYIMQ